ncbi:MAG: hypothetical protein RMY36_032790 [Nostoc sp. SerVER01]|nr:hypothetical protein [Nostoc sp. SerVER01]
MAARRTALYFSWNRLSEIYVDLSHLNNRLPTLYELRRERWPNLRWAENPIQYKQDISGFMDHVILSDFKLFGEFVEDITSVPVAFIQRVGDTGAIQSLDETLLNNIDTLVVVSLDHFRTEQKPTLAELEAVRRFLGREDVRLIVCPHHDIGAGDDFETQQVEFLHHGDRVVPPQQRQGGFAKELLAGLGLPIVHRFGMSPGKSPTGDEPAPLRIFTELDELKVLEGVTTFNIHPHLPHFPVPNDLSECVRVLAKQAINGKMPPHPLQDVEDGFFNALLWIPPEGSRIGNIFVCDGTLFTSAFGGLESLKRFWRNLAN